MVDGGDSISRRQPSQVYKQYVSRYLRERGHDVVGWK